MYFTSSVRITASNNETTALDSEKKLFKSFADDWWSYDLLHNQNKVRVPYITESLSTIGKLSNEATKSDKPLLGFDILDVGCGGGFVTEPLASLGAKVTGLDFCQELIDCAKEHANNDKSIVDNLEYICGTIEDYCEENVEKFDIVVAYEVLEHIQNVPLFIKSCAKVLKPGGSIFFSTINRTTKSWLVAKILYEYILRIIPVGTHHWDQFVQPEEIRNELRKYNCEVKSVDGSSCSYFSKIWSETTDTSVFYHLHAVKNC